MQTQDGDKAKATPETPPGQIPSAGDNGVSGDGDKDKGERTFSKAEVDKKLAGQAAALKKQIDEVNAKLAAHESAKAEEDQKRREAEGKATEVNAELREQVKAGNTRVAELEAEQKAWLDEIEAENTAAIEAMPEADRDLVPDVPPRQKAAWLRKWRTRFESLQQSQRAAAADTRPPRPGETLTPEQELQAAMERARQHAMGIRTEGGK